MDGMGNGLGIVYTPHQCWYSDRKSPYWEKSPKGKTNIFLVDKNSVT